MHKRWQQIRGDIIGGATAAVVALPLGIAFGIASGAGVLAGLYGSIFGGFVAAAFGGCGVQITGPTGAMIVILVNIIKQFGVGGMFLAGALAGLLQLIFGLFKFGKFVKYLPQPVIAGFTNGISILFFLTAVDDARATLSITVITAIVIWIALRYFKKLPESLFGLVAGLLINQFLINSPHVVGDVPFKIPELTLGIMPLANIGQLLLPALSICLLGSISALLSAQVTDEMTDRKHDSNKELIGQGLGNIVSSLLGGMPVSGAVARSGVNVFSGGRTKLSGMLHSVFLVLMILLLAPIVKRIPLASLAAILMVASIRTADWNSIKLLPRAHWKYGVIMTVTTILTVVKDLSIAVVVGTTLASLAGLVEIFLAKKKIRATHCKIETVSTASGNGIKTISFSGPLFFYGAEKIRNEVRVSAEENTLILDLSQVDNIDETGAIVLKDVAAKLYKNDKTVLFGGINEKPLKILTRLGIIDSLGEKYFFSDIDNAKAEALAMLT